jgi:hypothetical protein
MTPFILEALEGADGGVSPVVSVTMVLSSVVVAVSVLAKAVPIKLTVLAIANSSMADRMLAGKRFRYAIIIIQIVGQLIFLP